MYLLIIIICILFRNREENFGCLSGIVCCSSDERCGIMKKSNVYSKL